MKKLGQINHCQHRVSGILNSCKFDSLKRHAACFSPLCRKNRVIHQDKKNGDIISLNPFVTESSAEKGGEDFHKKERVFDEAYENLKPFGEVKKIVTADGKLKLIAESG